MNWGFWSLLPLALTLVLAFATRSALVGMLAGTVAGTLMLGGVPGVTLNELFQSSLGNGDFIWICQIVILIGIVFELFKRSGVMGELARRVSGRTGVSRRNVQLSAWGMGFVIVDDYFSPLLTGVVMRPMSDRAGIPREKLAYILDSTTASVCILVPFMAWGAYMAALIAAQGGPVASADEGLRVFISAIPYNFYPILLLLLTLLICLGVIPDFGPMRRAERRARETGALLRPGSKPLLSDEATVDTLAGSRPPSLLLELLLPVLLLVVTGTWTLLATGAVRIVEAFMLVVCYLFVVQALRGRFASVSEAGDVVVGGTRSVMAALLIVALAYALNAVTRELGAAEIIIEHFSSDLSANWLVALAFLVTSAISFSTGTSWGAFALMMPVALPVAYEISGGELAPVVYQTVAAVAGGGIFGDHSSPVSDTTVLSSLGAGSDHIDHVVTQLPYALLVGILTFGIYLWI